MSTVIKEISDRTLVAAIETNQDTNIESQSLPA